jgi:hypothetical protein
MVYYRQVDEAYVLLKNLGLLIPAALQQNVLETLSMQPGLVLISFGSGRENDPCPMALKLHS